MWVGFYDFWSPKLHTLGGDGCLDPRDESIFLIDGYKQLLGMTRRPCDIL